ncbi:2312_t:CDS:2 [Scutellospora calospora]|uniref:2312_t:CDS:1 n=1 Tax=Scutellospora calospora TaxID=85575 RepID=A0ACA9JVL8_9GLOM|nr:2312_t:CDS:2 [Scutellospora calospora]
MFLAEDNDKMIKDSEIEKVDDNSYVNYAEEFDKIKYDKLLIGNTVRQGVFDFNPTELAADLVKE